ncbi:MAG: cyanophycin synthetase [Polyangiaceae bacterium]
MSWRGRRSSLSGGGAFGGAGRAEGARDRRGVRRKRARSARRRRGDGCTGGCGGARDRVWAAAPPGRFEVVAERPYLVVDYAHSPDALSAVRTAKELCPGRVTVVFGAGRSRSGEARANGAGGAFGRSGHRDE